MVCAVRVLKEDGPDEGEQMLMCSDSRTSGTEASPFCNPTCQISFSVSDRSKYPSREEEIFKDQFQKRSSGENTKVMYIYSDTRREKG